MLTREPIMLLLQLALVAALSLSVCMLTQPLSANAFTQRHNTVAAGKWMATFFSTSVGIVLTRWLADTSLLAVMLMQLSLACYLAHSAMAININNAAFSSPTSPAPRAAYTPLLFQTVMSTLRMPLSLFSLGLFSLFISSQHSEWMHMIGIGSVHFAVVIGYLFIFPKVGSMAVFSSQHRSLVFVRIFLLTASIGIACRTVAHLY